MSTIPEGFTTLTPFITYDDAAKAIEFYKTALDANVIMSLQSPDGGVMYAELQIGTAKLMVGNPCPLEGEGQATTQSVSASPISFYVYVEDVNASFDKAKAAGMSEKKGIEDMFWGDRIGTLTDPFNVEWTIAEHVRDVSPEEVEEAMKQMAA